MTSPEDGDDWESRFDYEANGRWERRDASQESPFDAVAGSVLLDATPDLNELDEVVGLNLTFERGSVDLYLREGELRTTDR